jgi:hypothetical protein
MVENILTPDILIPLTVFSMPVALYWIKKHYNALEKGVIQPHGAVGEGARVKLLEAQNRELLERVQNLESIVVGLDEAPRQKALSGKREP